MTERIKKAIDIFLDAINEGTLMKAHCGACAVGNLCANALGMKINPTTVRKAKKFHDMPNALWKCLFQTDELGFQDFRRYDLMEYWESAEQLISKTGFSEVELSKIEYAFETNTKINWDRYYMHSKQEIRADQIRGLEAVVKVMLTFDDCKESVQEVFTSKAELIPV